VRSDRRTAATSITLAAALATAAAFPSRPAAARVRESPAPSPGTGILAAVDEGARAVLAEAPVANLSVGVLAGGRVYTSHHAKAGEDSRRPTDDTVYAIGSITKTITGTLLAQAAVEKKLRIDGELGPALGGGYPNLERDGKPVRLFHLLNHSSGLPRSLPEGPETPPPPTADLRREAEREAAAEVGYGPAELQRDLRAATLSAPPGERFRYSNAAAQVLGVLLEHKLGAPYDALVQRRIAGPLGLKATRVAPTAGEEARLAPAYFRGEPLRPHLSRRLPAAGSLHSTVTDLLKYAEWHAAEGEEATRLSHRTTWTPMPERDAAYTIGLAWQMRARGGYRLIWQDGSVPGYTSLCLFSPEKKVAVVVLSSQDASARPANLSPLANRVLAAIEPGLGPF
jgi:serine-type D-Ala-D-Ala carboxypeptidase/endopeptidase